MNEKNIFVIAEKTAAETEKLQQGNLEVLHGFGEVFKRIDTHSRDAFAISKQGDEIIKAHNARVGIL